MTRLSDIRHIVYITSIIFLALLFPSPAFANGLPFSATPITSVYQNTSISSYFDLNIQPDKTITEYLWIENKSNKSITLKVDMLAAISSDMYIISYVKPTEVTLPEKPYELHENIRMETDTLNLKANEKRKIAITIRTPPVSGKGVYLAAIGFTPTEVSQSPKNNKNDSVSVHSKTRMVIAVQLNLPKKEQANISVGNELDIRKNDRIQLFVPVYNKSRIIYQNTFTYIIEKKGKGKDKNQFHSKGQFSFTMAPDSQAKYPLDWKGIIEHGDFLLTIYDQNNKSIKSYPIVITEEEAERWKDYVSEKEANETEINETEANESKTNETEAKEQKTGTKKKDTSENEKEIDTIIVNVVSKWVWFVVGILGLVVFILIVLLFRKQKREQKTYETNEKQELSNLDKNPKE